MNDAILRRLQRLEDRRAELSGPVDGLSASLWEYGKELATLDDLGLIAEAEALDVSVADLRQMARSYTPPIGRR